MQYVNNIYICICIYITYIDTSCCFRSSSHPKNEMSVLTPKNPLTRFSRPHVMPGEVERGEKLGLLHHFLGFTQIFVSEMKGICTKYGGFQKRGAPTAGWFIRENPSTNGWFRGTPILGNPQICPSIRKNDAPVEGCTLFRLMWSWDCCRTLSPLMKASSWQA